MWAWGGVVYALGAGFVAGANWATPPLSIGWKTRATDVLVSALWVPFAVAALLVRWRNR